MTDSAFITLLNMSLTAGYVILALVFLRLLLPRAPRRLLYGLWALPLFRLVCPVSVESILSLLPSAQPIPPDIVYQAVPAIHSGIPALNAIVNPALAQSAPQAAASVNPLQIWCFAGKALWMIGLTALLCYAVVSYTRLAQSLRYAIREGEIWRGATVGAPMVLGLLRPRIYLPAIVAGEACILAHERAHIRRGDHIIKPLAFLVLCIHWFNPLAWLAYVLMVKDMEGACDEQVLRQASPAQRSQYAACLLDMGARYSGLTAPLAFGESDTAGRIKRILSYKKPAFWVVAALVIAAILLCITLLSNPLGSVPLLDAAQSISANTMDIITMAIIETGGEAQRIEQREKGEAVQFVKALRVKEQPVSQSRSAGRDRTHCLRLSFPSGGAGPYSIDFNFNGDYTEVWIDNGMKPSFSFRLAQPSQARAFFEGGQSTAIIGGADGPTHTLVSGGGGVTRFAIDDMAITGPNLSLFTFHPISNENPTYYIDAKDAKEALAQVPVYSYMMLSSLTQIEVLVKNPSVEELRLSHTLLNAEGRPVYYKPDGGALDEEGVFAVVTGGDPLKNRYVYSLEPSMLVALSSKMQPYPDGALRGFSLRYRMGEQWYECCFVLRTDEGMHMPGEVQAETVESGAPIITPADAAERYTRMRRSFQNAIPHYEGMAQGDWDGDGKEDRAGFLKKGLDRTALSVDFGEGGRITAKAADYSDAGDWGWSYSLLGADVNGDGTKEMLLLIDSGAQGGEGGFFLLAYGKNADKWEPLPSPKNGPHYRVYWDAQTHTVGLACPEIGYGERIVDEALIRPYLGGSLAAERIAWMDSLGAGESASSSDAISAFALTEEGHIITRQYVTAPGGSHAEMYGHMLTEYAYDAQNNLQVLSAWFVPAPAE